MIEVKVMGYRDRTENIFTCLEVGLKLIEKLTYFNSSETFLHSNYKISTKANPLN